MLAEAEHGCCCITYLGMRISFKCSHVVVEFMAENGVTSQIARREIQIHTKSGAKGKKGGMGNHR